MLNDPSTENSIAQKLVNITLELVDQGGGKRGVTLREVARQAGCAHTNIYNYYPNLDALLEAALKSLLLRLVGFTKAQMTNEEVQDPESFARFLTAQIDFALQHPGWYAFIWLDPIQRPIQDAEVQQTFRFLASRFAGYVFILGKGTLTDEQAKRVSDLLHTYLHGGICKLLGGRFLDLSPTEYRQQILSGCFNLLEGLIDSLPTKDLPE